ncbi:MAG: sulfite exporter TauE/SafE family protein [Pseudomonadota bacterium]
MEWLLPPGVAPTGALALVALSVLTSALTAAVGIGGGVVLLVAMTFVLPVEALIAVHGVVQLGSNLGRTAVLARHASFLLLLPFVVGCVLGVAIGASLVIDLNDAALLLLIGTFVVVTTWVKIPPLGKGEAWMLGGGGAVASVLTMFVGATGPFVIALLRQANLDHKGLVATSGAAMTVQHTLKVAAFAILGFAFLPYVPLMAAIIAAGFAGTLLGAHLLGRLPEQALKQTLRIVLTVLGIQLVARGVLGLL